MQKFIERLQFITHDIVGFSHTDQALKACEAGCKWIQYRCLTKSDDELLEEIKNIASICDDWGSTLIVTDHIQFAGKADIQGFHMEDPQADIAAIRAELGDDLTLGGTALNRDALVVLARSGADYAGFGPFAKSVTKPNSHPLIGKEMYVNACANLVSLGLTLPVIAVGGITTDDVEELMTTGIYGIAVSSALNRSPEFSSAYSALKNAMV